LTLLAGLQAVLQKPGRKTVTFVAGMKVYHDGLPAYNHNLTWGRKGFDGIVETQVAGRGFSLASLKNENLKINAKNDNFALAAA
jgi:hypothetical protein